MDTIRHAVSRSATTGDARHYLELIEIMPMERVGPILRVDESREKRVPGLGKAIDLSACIAREITKVDDRTYRAPSAWHAAAWLLDCSRLAARSEATPLHSPIPVGCGAPIFRGQRSSAWNLEPTLLREPRSPSDPEALEIFIKAQTEIFRLVSEETRMNGRAIHMAAAQHYGMKTTLLDFTADPRIAVWFAAGDDPSPGTEAVVYGLPLDAAFALGGAVILPPPWVKRLYGQRGLFVDCSEISAGEDLAPRCFRILFPADASYRDWLFPEGKDAVLPPERWYVKAIEWAQDASKEGRVARDSKRCGAELRAACGQAPFMFDALSPAAMQPALVGFVDMCEWLAFQHIGGRSGYRTETLAMMWRDNAPLFRSQCVIWQYVSASLGLEAGLLRADRSLAALEAVAISRPAEFGSSYESESRGALRELEPAAVVPTDPFAPEPEEYSVHDPWLQQLKREAQSLLAEALEATGMSYAELVELASRGQLRGDLSYQYEVAPYELPSDASAPADPEAEVDARVAALFFDAGRRFSRVQEAHLPEFGRALVCLHAARNFSRRVAGAEMRDLECRSAHAIFYLHITMADAIVEEPEKPAHNEMAARYAELEGFLRGKLGDREGAARAYRFARVRYTRAGLEPPAARAGRKEAELRQ